MRPRGLALSLGLLSQAPLLCFGGLNVALHAQSRYTEHGWVAGSEITTAGLLAALRAHPSVDHAQVFAPFSYAGLGAVAWDVLIIEGWAGPVPRVIQRLREASQCEPPP